MERVEVERRRTRANLCDSAREVQIPPPPGCDQPMTSGASSQVMVRAIGRNGTTNHPRAHKRRDDEVNG
jgi:hypothetical protein